MTWGPHYLPTLEKLALSYYRAGEYAAALPLLERLAARRPDDAEVASCLDDCRQKAPRPAVP